MDPASLSLPGGIVYHYLLNYQLRIKAAPMRNIRSEINYCLGNKTVIVSLTNLADLQTGMRGEGDSVWLEARNRG